MAALLKHTFALISLTVLLSVSKIHAWDDHKDGMDGKDGKEPDWKGRHHRRHHEPGCHGDPHFSGADGSHFDFSGVPNTTYCLLTDSHVNMNAFFGGYIGKYEERDNKPMTWMREISIQWGRHSIVLRARQGPDASYGQGYMESILVDGNAIKLTTAGDKAVMADGKSSIEWISAEEPSGDDKIDVYSVDIPGVVSVILELRPELPHFRTETDGTVHFDLYFPLVTLSNNVHGILGQTYRSDRREKLASLKLDFSETLNAYVVPGDNGESYLDGSVDDYKTSSLLAADCKFNRFAGVSQLDKEASMAMEVNSDTAVTSVLGSVATLKLPTSSSTYKRLRRLRLLRKFKLQ